MAIKSGFYRLGNELRFRATLCKFDNVPYPYVELILKIENLKKLSEYIICNDGDIYIPFFNPDMRHDNLVYEKVVTTYNNIMDKLCKKKILKHIRVRGKHGED